MVPLQEAGKAVIVFEGDAKEGLTGKTDLGDGLEAHVRVSESIYEDGGSGEVRPDTFVKLSEGSDGPLETALTLAHNFKPSTLVRTRLPGIGITAPEKSYPEMLFPNSEVLDQAVKYLDRTTPRRR